MFVIAVLGSKRSGKTTTIEALVEGLTERGYHVATIKHVSEPDFTLDTEGKDTWRHWQAGAQTVLTIANQEIGMMKKIDTTKLRFEKIVEYCGSDIDVVILEGFRKLISRESTVPKIVAIKSFEEATEASANFHPIIAFTCVTSKVAEGLQIPVVDVLRDHEQLVDIILSHMGSS